MIRSRSDPRLDTVSRVFLSFCIVQGMSRIPVRLVSSTILNYRLSYLGICRVESLVTVGSSNLLRRFTVLA